MNKKEKQDYIVTLCNYPEQIITASSLENNQGWLTFYDNNMDIINLISPDSWDSVRVHTPLSACQLQLERKHREFEYELAMIKHKEILDNIKCNLENEKQQRASLIVPHYKNNLLYRIIPKSHSDYFLLLCFIWAITYWVIIIRH